MSTVNETRRSVMLTAWDFRRAEPTRAFADCLRGAWKMIKGLAKAADRMKGRARKAGGRLRLSPDLTRSPIKEGLSAAKYRGSRAYQAAYYTAWLGR